MSVDHATAFVADGPTTGGFRTGGSRIEYGVTVVGTRCGVLGTHSSNSLGSVAPQNTGVCGKGEGAGVVGQSPNVAGVFTGGNVGSIASGNNVGTISSGDNVGAIASGDNVGAIASGDNVGLISSGRSVGVIALSNREREGTGVIATGSTNGVVSSSVRGDAILGKSTEGRGASLTSGRVAQLRLVPSQARRPPREGLVGDLFMHFAPVQVFGGAPTIALHICVRATQQGQPALWAPVVLGPVVPGA